MIIQQTISMPASNTCTHRAHRAHVHFLGYFAFAWKQHIIQYDSTTEQLMHLLVSMVTEVSRLRRRVLITVYLLMYSLPLNRVHPPQLQMWLHVDWQSVVKWGLDEFGKGPLLLHFHWFTSTILTPLQFYDRNMDANLIGASGKHGPHTHSVKFHRTDTLS